MSYVGTWEWALETGGALRRQDRLRLVGQGVAARLTRIPSVWRSRIFGEQATLEMPEPPDSRLALTAEELVRECSSPALYGHCSRTWAFAAMFAQRDAVAHDPELLYLACMLHDLGLTERHWCRDEHARCFAVEGARAAHALLLREGAEADRAATVAQAISLHLNVTVPSRLGAEAALLAKGVALDVVGRRLHQVPAAATGLVDQRWPRSGLAAELSGSIRSQARMRPAARPALLCRLGFVALIEANPLAAQPGGGRAD